MTQLWSIVRIIKPYRPIEGSTEPYRTIQSHLYQYTKPWMCDISPSTVFSRRRSFPLLCTSIIDRRCRCRCRRMLPSSSSSSFPSPTHTQPHTQPHSAIHSHSLSLSHTPYQNRPLQEITTDAKYRGICHITEYLRRAEHAT